MANIYNYSILAFKELQSESKRNPVLPFFLLVLLTIPLGYAVNGISVALFALVSLATIKKSHLKKDTVLILPMVLYGLMAASMVWTYDSAATTKALSKVLPLFILPLGFLVMPAFSESQKKIIIKYYSWGILGYTLFYLSKAVVRFVVSGDSGVFFYHELVTEDVNAIHVSVYASLAFFYFFIKPVKQYFDKLAMMILALFVFLLSSKNIIVVFLLLILFYELFYFRATQKIKWITVLVLAFLSLTIVFSTKIRDRFLIEFESNQGEGTLNTSYSGGPVYNVSVKQAWSKKEFQPNDYFAGAAFRVYQIRIFFEMLQEDPIFFTGYGLNATDFKIEEKGIEYNIFLGDERHEGYQKKNFHNQYVQLFAEVGVFGLLLIVTIVFLNLKNAFQTKHFIHICFAILMISLFLTESFLARQRGVVFFTAIYCLFNSRIVPKPLIRTDFK